ncbi:MAG: class I SAM-dependent methyltransferase [Promethearchaeota archaeon]
MADKKKERRGRHSNLIFGREIVSDWAKISIEHNSSPIRILDIGCSSGADLINIQHAMKELGLTIEYYGLDNSNNSSRYYKKNTEICKNHNIKYIQIDIENSIFPFPDQFFDLIISNQTMEHLKDIFWVFAEISRIIKKSGRIIIGVPNLASLYCRLKLLFGRNPPAIEIFGVHVRGYTRWSFKRFVEADNYFRLLKFKGSDFLPLGLKMSKFLSKIIPNFANSIFFLIERTEKDGNYVDCYKDKFVAYYTGTTLEGN